MTESSNEYQMVGGTEPNIDEQHEPRTILRTNQSGTYMMSEIGDGTFVQWSECATCHKRVVECPCPGGPGEPGHIHRWRVNRFIESMKGRGVEPALPVLLRDRDRRVNAVIRHLQAQGYEIVPPERPAFDPAAYSDEEEATPSSRTDLGEKVDAGMDDALAELRAAKAEGDPNDVGF